MLGAPEAPAQPVPNEVIRNMEKTSPEFEVLVEVFREEFPRIFEHTDAHLLQHESLSRGIDREIIGRILTCHLLVEHYLTRYLEAANPAIGSLNGVRLSFNQKLRFADGPRSLAALLLPGLKELNALRNKLAHDLSAVVSPESTRNMGILIGALYRSSREAVPEGVALIEEFARAACICLAGSAARIEETGGSFGLPGYNKWWDETIEAVRRKLRP